jgi:hypothetical protein
MLKKLRQAWIRLLILFDVKDPLKRTGKKFDLPEDFSELSPAEKRRPSICNLYANQNYSVNEIARHHEMSRTDVVAVLIEESLIEDQRQGAAASIKGGRRSIDR